MNQEAQGIYARALIRFRTEFMPVNKGKTFTSEDVYRYFLLDRKPNGVEAKNAMGKVLYNLSKINKERELEQTGKTYRIIDRSLNVIEWWKTKDNDTLKINWPISEEDQTSFGFDDSILIYPGDAIVVAGEGNTAKTAFCLNFMIANMNEYPCYYFTSEFNDAKFKDRMRHFESADLYKKDGTPKFTVAKQEQNWQDVIQKDAINIVDWIYLDDEMWKMRTIIKTIIESVGRGIALIVIQKRSYKQVGEGGEATKDLASVYLTIRNDRDVNKLVLKVEKVKSPGTSIDEEGRIIYHNPNFKEWSFDIVQGGSRFHNISPLIK